MENTISSDLIRGHIDTIILHTLLDGDKYAQQISDTVNLKSGNKYDLNQATLYSSLKRLENLKYVKAYWNDASGGRRKFFNLTPAGKEFVETNLSSWSFSRAIIDKLMDLEPEPVIKTKIVEVEKIVKVKDTEESPSPSPSSDITTEKVENKAVSPLFVKENNNGNTDINKQLNENRLYSQKSESIQEINFRNILNGLIKATAISKEQNHKEEKTEEKNENIPEKTMPVMKFNETITSNQFNSRNKIHSGKIDFTDVISMAEKEGFKVKISSKDNKISKGSVYINKVRLFSSLIIFLLSISAFLVLMVSCKDIINFSFPIVACSLAIMAVFPIITGIIYFKNPLKTSKIIKTDSILATAIIMFNFLIITLAINIFFSVNLYETYNLIVGIIIPLIVYVYVLLYFCIRYAFAKNKYFQVKNNSDSNVAAIVNI